jgi:acetyltransferase-like isoleucine patch superfamily enzyme
MQNYIGSNVNIFTVMRAGLFQTVWGIVKYIPSPIGDLFRFSVLKLTMKKISTIWIRPGVTIWWPERISIGTSSLNEDIHLNGFGGITIADHVLIGHRCTFFSDEHNFENPNELIWYQGRSPAPIVVEDDVYFGCNVVVLAGVTIGHGAVVGAGSVVTKDVPPLAIVGGIPAHVIRYRGDKLGKEKGI